MGVRTTSRPHQGAHQNLVRNSPKMRSIFTYLDTIEITPHRKNANLSFTGADKCHFLVTEDFFIITKFSYSKKQNRERGVFVTENKEKSTCEWEFTDALAIDRVGRSSIAYGNADVSEKQLRDVSEAPTDEKELIDQFTPKKEQSELLAQSYLRLGYEAKASRVKLCGTFLEFAHGIAKDGTIESKGRLHTANFCRDRLCAMCSWRRSLKIFGQVSKIMADLGDNYEYVFLTLTVRSVSAEELSETITRMHKSFEKLLRHKELKPIVLGYFRALEVTYNKNTDAYHPHFHCVLAMPKWYFKNSYIKRDAWLRHWQIAYGDEQITQVDIRKVKSKVGADLSSAIAEVTKYAVKGSDLVSDRVVSVFSSSLHKRRLVAFGGVFKDSYMKLNLQDVEAQGVDLVHIEDEELNPSIAELICSYGWRAGVYTLLDQRIEVCAAKSEMLDVEV